MLAQLGETLSRKAFFLGFIFSSDIDLCKQQKEFKQLQQRKKRIFRLDKNLRHTVSTTYSFLLNKHVRKNKHEKYNKITLW